MLRNESKYNQIAYFNKRSHQTICQISAIEAKKGTKYSVKQPRNLLNRMRIKLAAAKTQMELRILNVSVGKLVTIEST